MKHISRFAAERFADDPSSTTWAMSLINGVYKDLPTPPPPPPLPTPQPSPFLPGKPGLTN